MSSLRNTIVIRVILFVAVAGMGTAVTSFALVTLEMNKFLDIQLQEMAINIGPGAQQNDSPSAGTEDEDHLVVRIWDRSGNLIHRSGPQVDIPLQPGSGFTDVNENGQEWRIYRLTTPHQDIQIAQRWSARREVAVHAATGAALPFLFAIPVAWLVIGWSINRTLRGLRKLSSDIGQRSVDAVEPLRAVGVPAEITPLITAIDELVERHAQALEAQRRFVADAAHELRTPLAALQIQTENLLTGEVPEASRELLDDLGSGVRRASRLASQLLEMARTEHASTPVRQNFDLAALMSSVLSDFVPVADARNIELAMHARQPHVVESDPNAIRVLLCILIENALRYSAPGGLVEVNLDAAGETTILEVLDCGHGIPREAMPFIYDRFFRAAPRDIEGAGLGLAIAKKTADNNGLRLSHRNRAGKNGIIATVEFPGEIATVAGIKRAAGR